jgi:signal transduction histidine kinase
LEDNRIGTLSDEQKELVQSLKGDNQRMLRILSELLNLSQVEAGKLQLNIQPVEIYKVVESSVTAVSGTAREKYVQIEQRIEPGLPEIKADPDKMVWVLNNFLTNAIRYSPAKSTITVEVKKAKLEISFSVSDQGQGIEESYLSRIFERYYQVPGRSDKKGSGIGLAICKEFVEAMGGRIWVNSQVGKGSTFGFHLPITA